MITSENRVLPDKLVVMVTPDNLGSHFLMLHILILKVTKFQLPPPKRLSTVVTNILEASPPMSNSVKKPNISRNTPWNCNFSLLFKNLPLKLHVIQTPLH